VEGLAAIDVRLASLGQSSKRPWSATVEGIRERWRVSLARWEELTSPPAS
jgi:hypothetical protein